MKRLLAIFTFSALLFSFNSQAVRIKDVSSVEGVRSNQLVGYGLVVGLPGTGEKSSAFSEQSFATMLRNFGINVPQGVKLKIKNVAPVAITAELPAFTKPGQKIDVTVSAIGEAKSLRGGELLQTFLKGVDGNVYALAQGSLVVGGLGAEGADGSKVVINTPTVGRISNGAIVEREIASPFGNGDYLTFNLNRPDFSTAKRMADTINQLVGPNTAKPMDATSVRVYAPRDISQRVSYLATLENLDFEPASESAKVIVNSRTGTIVIGKDVRLLPTAITHGGITVTIAEAQTASQPNALAGGETVVTDNSTINVTQEDSRMFKFDTGVSLDQLVRAVNQVGLAPGDLMAILEALKQAGALQGELIII
ncbi:MULTISPECIES: flagellar basal body P-ring protein FlgI [unclassified Motilimonas]|uniref:flagellar basal body P-ring protein FlgI n=1 Tax=Motilimonas TaxID=1914248 RepID=UPI001E592FA5|nr:MULTISPECIES: flagellar basal body P-ring protein FlgI [unclassified Motilimonas]MCE0556202.1 flagellar basal body P-ring protein FlgI [Motilimonas sp. E26]MDO6524948.1 flagellar basal body P-ring protein FlgI [Motilimonas sp. 1_MG-2023]